jgi:SNF2 family DNA or RNA helicase/uncharacterized Zn finger protein
MAKQYGNTWWGKQWLDALSGLDYSNRIPRGKTYANTGKVKDFEIANGLISAKVQGSQPKPYKIQVSLSQFTVQEKETLVRLITENPFLLSSLLNKELPQELDEEARKEGIKIFPTSWNSMSAKCSCPDYAMPCKHIAAVIYVIANEIDKNPFLLFQIKGIDILEEIQKVGFTNSGALASNIVMAEKMFLPTPDKTRLYDFSPKRLDSIDFSTIPESHEAIFKILDEKPIFYNAGNFKTLLKDFYQRAGKAVSKGIQTTLPTDSPTLQTSTENVRLWANEALEYVGISADDNTKKLKINYIHTLIAELKAIPISQFSQYEPTLISLYFHVQFAQRLVAQNAIVPQLVEVGKQNFVIRYLPALIIPEVKHIFETLCDITQDELIGYETKKQTLFLDRTEQSYVLLHWFIGYFLTAHIEAPKTKSSKAPDPIEELFFQQEVFNSNVTGYRETPSAISNWLQKFYLSQKQYVPVLKIEETEDDDFRLSVWVENKKDTLQDLISLKNLFKKKEFQAIRVEALQDISLLASQLTAIKPLIASKGELEITVSAQELTDLLLHTLPTLRLLGIPCLLPKALQKLAKPRLSGQMMSKGSVGSAKSFVNFDSILSFDWQIALGDELVSPVEFLKLVKGLKGLVKINDQYVMIDEKELQAIMKKLQNPPNFSEAELLRIALAEDYEGAKILLDEKAREMMRKITQVEEVPLPTGLQASLRPYQKRGFEWLYKNASLGFGSVLADDMGLGKTLQVITLLLKFKQENKLKDKKALIVLPTTLITNWEKEVKKFAPELQTFVYHGTNRKANFEEADIILTTYGVVRSDIATLQKIKWALLAIDEAQNIKNTDTEQTKAVKKLKSEHIVAMSGTPVENRLSEYWSIFDFANKGYLGALNGFKEAYIKPIEVLRDQEQLESFKKITAPFIMRRVKTDKSIISDLPDKVEIDDLCTLTTEQAALYESFLKTMMGEIEGEEGVQRQGLIFKLMIALKQICNHPSNFLKKDTIQPELSGKTQMLTGLLDNILEAGEKTLIFTQYKEMGDLLVRFVQENYKFNPLWLHGGCSRKERDEMVEVFQNKPNPKIMILSLKAGGTGLNLVQANHVIHYDLWWNPAVEAQATDRAFRIGQKKNVQVHRFITKNTFEEKINAMIQAKKELASLTVSTGENWIGNLSNEDLKYIFRLDK